VIGAGGIGFDVCELLSPKGVSFALDLDVYQKEWCIDFANHPRGGVTGVVSSPEIADHDIYLLQRKNTKVGQGLGKTTGWTHRLALRRRGVKMMNDVRYQKIDDQGLHILQSGQPQLLEVDTVVICTGQESRRSLFDALEAEGAYVSVLGGAYQASELKAAIDQACRLAADT